MSYQGSLLLTNDGAVWTPHRRVEKAGGRRLRYSAPGVIRAASPRWSSDWPRADPTWPPANDGLAHPLHHARWTQKRPARQSGVLPHPGGSGERLMDRS